MTALKKAFAPHLGRNIVFGRKKPHVPRFSPRLSHYLKAAAPTPPSSVDFSSKAASVLADIYGNDELGDCVIAGNYHVVAVETGNAGDLFHATKAQILGDYEAIGGYNPNAPLVHGENPTDQGCDVSAALTYYVRHGYANGTKLLGFVSTDAKNKAEVMSGIDLFENAVLGMCLPDAWVNPFPEGNGFVWDVAGDPVEENGHCVIAVGYDASGVLIDSWGLIGKISWAALAKYATAAGGGEMFFALTPDQMTKGSMKAPNGFAWTDLIADFDALGGNVPEPAPVVPPPNPPTPVAPPPAANVTLAQAESWVTAGFVGRSSIMTKSQAISSAKAGLVNHWPK